MFNRAQIVGNLFLDVFNRIPSRHCLNFTTLKMSGTLINMPLKLRTPKAENQREIQNKMFTFKVYLLRESEENSYSEYIVPERYEKINFSFKTQTRGCYQVHMMNTHPVTVRNRKSNRYIWPRWRSGPATPTSGCSWWARSRYPLWTCPAKCPQTPGGFPSVGRSRHPSCNRYPTWRWPLCYCIPPPVPITHTIYNTGLGTLGDKNYVES